MDDVLGVHAALAVERRYGRTKPYIIGETIVEGILVLCRSVYLWLVSLETGQSLC